ncbi:MAG: MerR family transcriptional regulator [Leptothrix sp. (in: b-proteobacteria)]
MENSLPEIPPKRYFTIGEVSELCGVKPYVLRYWEQEFTQLRPMKRRGNRRYYQHHEVLLIRRIRDLLYEQGFTISGARNRLAELGAAALTALPSSAARLAALTPTAADLDHASVASLEVAAALRPVSDSSLPPPRLPVVDMTLPLDRMAVGDVNALREELFFIRELLDW